MNAASSLRMIPSRYLEKFAESAVYQNQEDVPLSKMASDYEQQRYQHYSCLRNGSADSETEMAKHQSLSNNDLMQAALDGDLEATYQLGCRFLAGSHGVSVNAAQAIKWLQKAADEGHSDAQTNLGSCYMHGRGVPLSVDKAVKMYRKASAKKNVNGMYNLGVCYRNGLGVKARRSSTEELPIFVGVCDA